MNAWRRSQIVLLAALGTLSVCAPDGGAAAATIPGCTGGQVSAIDQYCETIPTSEGGRVPRDGAPSVATTLPPAVVRRLAASPQRALLSLPAAVPAAVRKAAHRHHARFHTVAPPAPAATPVRVYAASIWSLSEPLIEVLVAVALALSGLAVVRRRRRSA